MSDKSLYESILELGVENSAPEFLDIAQAVLTHILGLSTAYDLQHDLKHLVDFSKMEVSAQKFRLSLADTSYVHLNLKFFCFNLLLHPLNPGNLYFYGRAFDISRNDIVMVNKMLKRRGIRRALRNNDKFNVAKADVDVRAFNAAFDTFNTIYPDILRHIKRKAYTKLKFISTSTNTEFGDFHMDLICKALQTYIRMVPTDKSELHIANYIRNTINNHVVNTIKKHTAKKRECLTQGKADGFGGFEYEMQIVSENQLFRAFGLENMSYENLQNAEANHEEQQLRESEISFQRVLKRFGSTRKRKVLILLVSGIENLRFTEYLRKHKFIDNDQDNVDLHAKLSEDAYFRVVCDYLSIQEKNARKFMYRIAKGAYPEKLEVQNANCA